MMIPETIADLLAANHNQEWQRDALCAQVDHDLFFPDPCGSAAAAKRICQGCDVKTECLQYALDNHINHGVWGGLSDRERRTLTRKQRVGSNGTGWSSLPRVERDAEIIRLTTAGATAERVAEQMGVSQRTVWRALARHTAATQQRETA